MLFTLAGEALNVSGLALSPSFSPAATAASILTIAPTAITIPARAPTGTTPPAATRQAAIAGTEDELKDLCDTYATEADTLDAAKADLRRINSSKAKLELAMPTAAPTSSSKPSSPSPAGKPTSMAPTGLSHRWRTQQTKAAMAGGCDVK
jgi:hypothetical protein